MTENGSHAICDGQLYSVNFSTKFYLHQTLEKKRHIYFYQILAMEEDCLMGKNLVKMLFLLFFAQIS